MSVAGLGTALNISTVAVGTAAGLRFGKRIKASVSETAFLAVGTATLALGARSFMQTHNAVIPVVSLILGALLGGLIDVEARMEGLGERLKRWANRRLGSNDDATFVEGFVSASLLFCVGPMTVLGSLQDGISGNLELLAIKSALDGLVSLVYAARYGRGVGFSVLAILVVQGCLTVVGAILGDHFLTTRMVAELEATGGVMIIAIGVQLLELRKLPVASFFPALVIAPAIVAVFGR